MSELTCGESTYRHGNQTKPNPPNHTDQGGKNRGGKDSCNVMNVATRQHELAFQQHGDPTPDESCRAIPDLSPKGICGGSSPESDAQDLSSFHSGDDGKESSHQPTTVCVHSIGCGSKSMRVEQIL